MFYTAGADGDGVDSPWTAVELTEPTPQDGRHFLPISMPLEVIRDASFFDLDEVSGDAVTVQTSDTTGGGVLWTLDLSWSDDARAISRWEVAEAGHLASFSMEIDGLFSSVGLAPSTVLPDVFIRFTPHDDSDHATAPPVGEPLDVRALDVPEDVPLIDD